MCFCVCGRGESNNPAKLLFSHHHAWKPRLGDEMWEFSVVEWLTLFFFCTPYQGSSPWKMSLPWSCVSQSFSHSNQWHWRNLRRCKWRLKRPSNSRNWQRGAVAVESQCKIPNSTHFAGILQRNVKIPTFGFLAEQRRKWSDCSHMS